MLCHVASIHPPLSQPSWPSQQGTQLLMAPLEVGFKTAVKEEMAQLGASGRCRFSAVIRYISHLTTRYTIDLWLFNMFSYQENHLCLSTYDELIIYWVLHVWNTNVSTFSCKNWDFTKTGIDLWWGWALKVPSLAFLWLSHTGPTCG